MINIRRLLFASTIALAATCLASATSIVQTFTLGGGPQITNWSKSSSISQFNTGLGTLLDIRFLTSFSTYLQDVGTDNNPGSTGTDSFVFSGSTNGNLGDPTNSLIVAPSTSVSSTILNKAFNSTFIASANTTATAGVSNATYLIDPSLYASGCNGTAQAGCLALATPNPFAVDPLVYSVYLGNGTILLTGSASTFGSFYGPPDTETKSGNATMSVTVIYDYTAASTSGTPEPATMALFGSGLIGLGLLRRRMNKKK